MGKSSLHFVCLGMTVSFLAALASACGGNVVVDKPGGGGTGGTTGAGATGAGATGAAGSTGTAGSPNTSTGTVNPTNSTGTGPSAEWEPFEFKSVQAKTPCNGSKYVKYSPKYGKYVGVSLCNPIKYKIYLGESKDNAFYEVADGAGGGEDHCELVNPNFTLPNEDDITSGGCKTCEIQSGSQTPIANAGYSRAYFGEPFEFNDPWPSCCDYTPSWYSCGITIP